MQATGTTVLVVDDDPDLLAVVQEGLASLGYEVLLADSGASALEVLASHPSIELLMVDVKMGGMSGLELIRRANELRPGLKALIMTGGAEVPGGRDNGHEPALLRKPFRVADLARAIAIAMSGDVTR
jgi:CheY-like chemotaxis protein